MNYKQHRKCELLSFADERNLVVDLESMFDKPYRITGQDVNDIPILIWVKVLAILKPRGYYK